MRKKKLITKVTENNSKIIKKHNHRLLNNSVIREKAKSGFYKNPEFN